MQYLWLQAIFAVAICDYFVWNKVLVRLLCQQYSAGEDRKWGDQH